MYPRHPAGFPTAAMRRTVIRLPGHQAVALRDVSIFFFFSFQFINTRACGADSPLRAGQLRSRNLQRLCLSFACPGV